MSVDGGRLGPPNDRRAATLAIAAGLALGAVICALLPSPEAWAAKGHGPCMAVATPAEQAILARESRGWPHADNPTSTAFGCGQLLAGNRRRFARVCGCHPNTLAVHEQMCMMRAYIADRYGTTARALQHWHTHRSY